MAVQDLITSCLPKSPKTISVVPMALAVVLVSSTATAEDTSRSIKIDRPVIGLSPTQVCSGISYYDFEGNPHDGTLRCGQDTCAQDGATGCLATQEYPAADIANISAGDLKKDKTIAGVTGTLPNCNTNGQTDCVTNASFTAAEMAKVTAGNIKKDATIAGVTGAYPSESFPLPGHGTSTRVLNGDNFVASLMQTAESTEFWDHKGVRHAGSTTAKIIPENIKVGVAIFGIPGNILPYSGFDPVDLRIGVEIGGITGTLKTDCRNSSTQSASDPYATIDDNALPTLKPFGVDHHCAADIWVGKYNELNQEGTCTSLTQSCVWQNTVTKTYWGGNQPSLTYQSFTDARDHCVALSAGGYSTGWRLPTQKELMSAYAQGAVWMAGDNTSLKGPHDTVWSSTASSYNTGKRYAVNMRSGKVTAEVPNIGTDVGVICVHDNE